MTLRIDQSDLLMAFGSHDIEYYLDAQTGQVVPYFEDMEEEEIDFEAEQDRYLWIDPRPSNEGFRAMEEFAYRQSDDVREDLLQALERRRPFRSFKDALIAYPDVRKAWFEFEEQGLLEYARAWLRSEGIEAELVSVLPLAPAVK